MISTKSPSHLHRLLWNQLKLRTWSTFTECTLFIQYLQKFSKYDYRKYRKKEEIAYLTYRSAVTVQFAFSLSRLLYLHTLCFQNHRQHSLFLSFRRPRFLIQRRSCKKGASGRKQPPVNTAGDWKLTFVTLVEHKHRCRKYRVPQSCKNRTINLILIINLSQTSVLSSTWSMVKIIWAIYQFLTTVNNVKLD